MVSDQPEREHIHVPSGASHTQGEPACQISQKTGIQRAIRVMVLAAAVDQYHLGTYVTE
jgi:hypothetical protein